MENPQKKSLRDSIDTNVIRNNPHNANAIILGGERIEALKSGKVNFNGKPIKTVEDAEKVINVLIRGLIFSSGGSTFLK